MVRGWCISVVNQTFIFQVLFQSFRNDLRRVEDGNLVIVKGLDLFLDKRVVCARQNQRVDVCKGGVRQILRYDFMADQIVEKLLLNHGSQKWRSKRV